MPTKKSRWPIGVTGAVLTISAITNGASSFFAEEGSLLPFVTASVTVFLVSGATFLSFYWVNDIRHAIAASFVMTYFAILAILLFLPGIRQSLFENEAIGAGLVGNLTQFVSIIVSAYFVGSAVEAGIAGRSSSHSSAPSAGEGPAA